MTSRSVTVSCPDCGRPIWVYDWQVTHRLTCETIRCERSKTDA